MLIFATSWAFTWSYHGPALPPSETLPTQAEGVGKCNCRVWLECPSYEWLKGRFECLSGLVQPWWPWTIDCVLLAWGWYLGDWLVVKAFDAHFKAHETIPVLDLLLSSWSRLGLLGRWGLLADHISECLFWSTQSTGYNKSWLRFEGSGFKAPRQTHHGRSLSLAVRLWSHQLCDLREVVSLHCSSVLPSMRRRQWHSLLRDRHEDYMMC